MAKINAPIRARFIAKPLSTGKVWKISVVGTRNSSSNEAPSTVLLPNTSRIDPAISATIAATNNTEASGSGMPLAAMKPAVSAKLVNLAGRAFTNTAAISTRPRKSNSFEAVMGIRSPWGKGVVISTLESNCSPRTVRKNP